MKNFVFVFIVLLSFVFPAQSQDAPVMQKSASGNEIHIDLYSACKNKLSAIPFSMFADNVKFIPLETTDDCLLSETCKISAITQNDIFVFDYEKCYRFDRKGKFLNAIGAKGNGPGEYTRPMSAIVDTLNQWIYFPDHWTGRLLKYDYLGNFLEESQPKGLSSNVWLHKPMEFLFGDSFYQYAKKGERFSISFYSLNEKRLLSKMRCEYEKDIPKLMICIPNVYNYKGNTYVKDFWCDTIYQLTNPYKLVSHAIINRGRLGYRTQDDKSLISGVEDSEERITIAVHSIAETDRFIFIGSNQGRIVYDKKSDKTIAANYDVHFMDDLYGSPGLVYFVSTTNGNEVYQAIHAYEFIENGDGKHSITDARYDAYRKMVDGLDEEDNPVIMIVKIKR